MLANCQGKLLSGRSTCSRSVKGGEMSQPFS